MSINISTVKSWFFNGREKLRQSIDEKDNTFSYPSRNQNTKAPRFFTFMKIAAAALLIFLLGTSKPGMEAIAKVKNLFAPQKNVVQQIEGEKEKHEVNLKESNSGYVIYLDDSYFTIERLKDKDIITPKNKLVDSKFPELYMEIKQISNERGGSFVIMQQLFIEAEEGMGARFNNILKEFRVTE